MKKKGIFECVNRSKSFAGAMEMLIVDFKTFFVGKYMRTVKKVIERHLELNVSISF